MYPTTGVLLVSKPVVGNLTFLVMSNGTSTVDYCLPSSSVGNLTLLVNALPPTP